MEAVRVFRQHRHETEGAGGTDELVTGVRQVRRVPCEIRTYDKKDGSGTGQANRIDKLYPSYDQPQITQNAPQQPYTAPQSSYSQNNAQPWQQPQNAPQGGWNRGQF